MHAGMDERGCAKKGGIAGNLREKHVAVLERRGSAASARCERRLARSMRMRIERDVPSRADEDLARGSPPLASAPRWLFPLPSCVLECSGSAVSARCERLLARSAATRIERVVLRHTDAKARHADEDVVTLVRALPSPCPLPALPPSPSLSLSLSSLSPQPALRA